jgi:hypothetical protein
MAENVNTEKTSVQEYAEPQWNKGLYYNASYEIENFIQLYSDDAKGDPFKVLNDPTYSGFKIFFHFSAESGLLATKNHQNSALAYLARIGQNTRYDLLVRFINVLSKVNTLTPWVFQEINGIDEIFSNKRVNVLRNHEITIDTLETIDGKMGSLIQMYRDISWDDIRKVWVLPENLRKFSMSIYIYDFRVFDQTSSTAYELLQTIKNTDIKQLNHVMFDLGHCQFLEDSGKKYFESVTNNRSDFNSSNITILTEEVSISYLFKSITGEKILSAQAFELPAIAVSGSVGTNINGEKDTSIVGRLKSAAKDSALVKSLQDKYLDVLDVDKWKTKAINLAANTVASAIASAESALTKLYLGNVYGFGITDLDRLANSSSLTDLWKNSGGRESRVQSLGLGNTEKSELGNVNTK